MSVLIIDIGSSSVRALLFDREARPIAEAIARQPYQFKTTPPGAAVVEAEQVRMLTEQCLDAVLKHPDAQLIEAVGMATFVGNILGVDEAGKPSTPVLTYADLRSAAYVDDLRGRLDVEKAHQRTGCLHHTAYLPGKLAWMRETQPTIWAKVSQWIDLGAHLYSTWFGKPVTSYSVASWSGMLNRAELTWDAEWLNILGMSAEQFSTLGDYSEPQRGLLDTYARRWPVLREVPFYLAVGDGAAANIGVGATETQQIALTIGTTAALRVVTQSTLPNVPTGLWSYRVDRAHHLIGGATSEGGNIFQWAQNSLRLPDDEAVERHLQTAPPDAHGLTFLPLLAGERSPGWAGNATGSIAGLRLSTTPLDMLQAALEGVALRLSLIAEQLRTITGDDPTVLTGGGALDASPAWAQIVANALNRPLYMLAAAETTARGVAVLVLSDLQGHDLADFALMPTHEIAPQADGVAALRRARERQQELYAKLVRD